MCASHCSYWLGGGRLRQVINAVGRRTPVDRWLEDIGAAPAATWSADCGVAY